MKKFFLCAALAACAFSLWAEGVDYSGSLCAQVGVGLPQTEDNKGAFLVGNLVFDNVVKAYLGESMFYLDAALLVDGVQSQSTNGVSKFVSADNVFALKLQEAYIDYNGGFWALRAGRQIAGWGKADGIQIADILCPKDESNMIASSYKESRLGIDALRLSFMNDFMQTDLYWVPIFTPSVLPFAKKNPLNQILFPSKYEGLDIKAPQSQSDLDVPSLKIYNSEFAARASFYFSKFDLSFYGFYGWDDLPLISYEMDSATSVKVGGQYKRMAMVGADAAIPCGDFVFRLEAAFFPRRNIQTSSAFQAQAQLAGLSIEAGEEKEQLLGLAGLDWTLAGGWTITAQYIADGIFGSASNLDRKVYQHQASLSVQKKLFNETLSVSFLGFLDLNDLSSLAELSAEYSLTDSIKLALIGDFFNKGMDWKDGVYGRYKNLSCATLRTKISF